MGEIWEKEGGAHVSFGCLGWRCTQTSKRGCPIGRGVELGESMNLRYYWEAYIWYWNPENRRSLRGWRQRWEGQSPGATNNRPSGRWENEPRTLGSNQWDGRKTRRVRCPGSKWRISGRQEWSTRSSMEKPMTMECSIAWRSTHRLAWEETTATSGC